VVDRAQAEARDRVAVERATASGSAGQGFSTTRATATYLLLANRESLASRTARADRLLER
jgi:hypothetical protein